MISKQSDKLFSFLSLFLRKFGNFNPNKAGLFKGSFSWRGQFDPAFIFQEEFI